jgi:predicted Zn finger-like uncharacterized protein
MSIFTVECPSCETGFPVDPAKVPPGGVRARCSVCGGIFPVDVPGPSDVAAEPAALDPSSAPATATRQETVVDEPPVSTADRLGEASFPEGGPDPELGPEPWSGVDDDATAAAVDVEEEGWEDAEVEAEHEPPEGVEIEVEESGWEGVEVEAEEKGWGAIEVEADIEAEPEVEVEEEESADEAVEEAVEAEAEEAVEDVLEAEVEVEKGGWQALEGAIEVEPEAERFDLGSAFGGERSAEVAAPDEAAPLPQSFQFGQRDPHDKARRLARVLVSDIITYNPERYLQALENDTLREDFDEEIRKSWAEYVEQVGSEMARETRYWTEALNDLLARGRPVF